MLSREKIALIHVAANRLALSNDDYRAILESCCGVSSSKDIKSPADFKALMDAFKRMGFNQDEYYKKLVQPETATAEQTAYIKALWLRITRADDVDQALETFTRNRFRTEFSDLTKNKASNVIQALKEMLLRTAIHRAFKIIRTEYQQEVSENQLYQFWNSLSNRFSAFDANMTLAALLFDNPELMAKVDAAQKIAEETVSPLTS